MIIRSFLATLLITFTIQMVSQTPQSPNPDFSRIFYGKSCWLAYWLRSMDKKISRAALVSFCSWQRLWNTVSAVRKNETLTYHLPPTSYYLPPDTYLSVNFRSSPRNLGAPAAWDLEFHRHGRLETAREHEANSSKSRKH